MGLPSPRFSTHYDRVHRRYVVCDAHGEIADWRVDDYDAAAGRAHRMNMQHDPTYPTSRRGEVNAERFGPHFIPARRRHA